jgi:hypothetical protein
LSSEQRALASHRASSLRTFIWQLIVGLELDRVGVARIAGHSNVAVTLKVYADEFDKTMHREDLSLRIEKAGFGAV